MWGLKKKLNLGAKDVPSAKKDKSGNLITTQEGLLSLYKDTYLERLSHKEIRPEQEGFLQCQTPISTLRLKVEV